MAPLQESHHPPDCSRADDTSVLYQQIERMTEINQRLIAEGMFLRQQLDSLKGQNAESIIEQLRECVTRLSQENADVTRTLERERAEHNQIVSRLEDELRSQLALINHQHARLKEIFRAGLTGTASDHD